MTLAPDIREQIPACPATPMAAKVGDLLVLHGFASHPPSMVAAGVLTTPDAIAVGSLFFSQSTGRELPRAEHPGQWRDPAHTVAGDAYLTAPTAAQLETRLRRQLIETVQGLDLEALSERELVAMLRSALPGWEPTSQIIAGELTPLQGHS